MLQIGAASDDSESGRGPIVFLQSGEKNHGPGKNHSMIMMEARFLTGNRVLISCLKTSFSDKGVSSPRHASVTSDLCFARPAMRARALPVPGLLVLTGSCSRVFSSRASTRSVSARPPFRSSPTQGRPLGGPRLQGTDPRCPCTLFSRPSGPAPRALSLHTRRSLPDPAARRRLAVRRLLVAAHLGYIAGGAGRGHRPPRRWRGSSTASHRPRAPSP